MLTLNTAEVAPGAVENQDTTVNGSSNPAALNSYIAIYVTGFGAYLPLSPDGLQRLANSVQAFVGGKPAQVQFAGHAPLSTLGLQQINILIPADAPTGPAVPIQLEVDGVPTQAGVTIAIQSASMSSQ